MDHLTFRPRCPLCGSQLEAISRPAELLTSGTSVCGSCRQQLSLRVSPTDNKLYVRMLTLPVGTLDPGETSWRHEEGVAAATSSSAATHQRRTPASPRTAALPELRDSGDLRRHLEKNFVPPEYRYYFFLTPGELCDIAERYADLYLVKWNDHDRRLSAERDALAQLKWKATPDVNAITVVGLYVFRSPLEAKTVWTDEGMYGRELPVERALDIRGRYALNFQSGSYSYTLRDLEDIAAAELWPRICRYCQEVGAPIVW